MIDTYNYTENNVELGRIEFNEKEKTMKVIGHFQGYICGMLTAFRAFELLPYDFYYYTDETFIEEPCTLYKLKTGKKFDLFKQVIVNKLETHIGIKDVN